MVPLMGAIKVLRHAERCIRHFASVAPHKNNLNLLESLVKTEIGTADIFLLGGHVLESQYGIDNHHYQLISLLVETYHSIQLHHMVKLKNMELQRGTMRKKHGKLLLFKGH